MCIRDRVDVARPSERQAGAFVVAVGNGIIFGPLLSAPFGIGKVKGLRCSFGIGESFSLSFEGQRFAAGAIRAFLCGIQDASTARHVRRIGIGPVSAEIRLSIWKSGSGSCRSCGLLCAASSTATASTATSSTTTLAGCCSAGSRRALRTRGGTALLTLWRLNGNNHLHEYQRSKNH